MMELVKNEPRMAKGKFKKIVEFSTKGLTPPPLVEKNFIS